MKFVMLKKLSGYCGRKQSPEITRHTRVHVTLKVKETDVRNLVLRCFVHFLRDLTQFMPVIWYGIEFWQDL